MRGKAFGTVASPVVAVGRASGGGPQLISRVTIPGQALATVTGSVSPPTGANQARIKGVGAGAPGLAVALGRGGGGGAYAFKLVQGINPATAFSYSVPRASLSTNTDVTAGSTTVVLAGQTILSAAGAVGATGGQASSSVGDVVRSGGNGSTNTGTSTSNATAGANGGAAGVMELTPNSNNGGPGGGSAGDRDDPAGLWLGADGALAPTNAAGLPAPSYGGGGSGGNNSATAGGRGSPGILIFEFWSV